MISSSCPCRYDDALSSLQRVPAAALRRWPAAVHLRALVLLRAGSAAAAVAAFADAIALAPADIALVRPGADTRARAARVPAPRPCWTRSNALRQPSSHARSVLSIGVCPIFRLLAPAAHSAGFLRSARPLQLSRAIHGRVARRCYLV